MLPYISWRPKEAKFSFFGNLEIVGTYESLVISDQNFVSLIFYLGSALSSSNGHLNFLPKKSSQVFNGEKGGKRASPESGAAAHTIPKKLAALF